MKTIGIHGENIWVQSGKKGHWLGKGGAWDSLKEAEVLALINRIFAGEKDTPN